MLRNSKNLLSILKYYPTRKKNNETAIRQSNNTTS